MAMSELTGSGPYWQESHNLSTALTHSLLKHTLFRVFRESEEGDQKLARKSRQTGLNWFGQL